MSGLYAVPALLAGKSIKIEPKHTKVQIIYNFVKSCHCHRYG